MKFATTLAAVVALVASASTADAALSPGCLKYRNDVLAPTNPLSKCRTYVALGFPGITGTGDHDTVKLAGHLDKLCAQPACTDAQYKEIFDGFNTNCKADMVVPNDQELGNELTLWYLSPAQREAVCFKNKSTSKYCVIESMDSMIARKQLPDGQATQDDLYGYMQYVTPVRTPTGMTTAEFCTPCNQQVANIFATYYKKSPSVFPLNFETKLDSTRLLNDLEYQYKTACKVDITAPMDPTSKPGGKDGKDDKDTKGNSTKGDDPNSAAIGLSAANALSGVVAVVAGVAGMMAYL